MTQIQNTSQSIAATKDFRIEAREHTLAPPGRHRPRHSQMSLTACQSRPAIDAAIYRPNSTLYQLQLSFHTQSTEPEPTARACLYVCTDGSRRACGVGACARLVATKSDPRETSGPRIDRIPPTRPSSRDRQYRELKKLIFSAPIKRPTDLFGPVANRTILKQLHARSEFGLLVSLHAASPLGRQPEAGDIVACCLKRGILTYWWPLTTDASNLQRPATPRGLAAPHCYFSCSSEDDAPSRPKGRHATPPLLGRTPSRVRRRRREPRRPRPDAVRAAARRGVREEEPSRHGGTGQVRFVT